MGETSNNFFSKARQSYFIMVEAVLAVPILSKLRNHRHKLALLLQKPLNVPRWIALFFVI